MKLLSRLFKKTTKESGNSVIDFYNNYDEESSFYNEMIRIIKATYKRKSIYRYRYETIATSYIQNITMVQRETISKVMNCINESAVAALLIGKIARASELNVRFILREGCYYSPSDITVPSEILVTVIGNLIDNAFESMNDMNYNGQKELLFGMYSKPGALLITTDDTGSGIEEGNIDRIFENDFSTKGNGRGTGLYQVKKLVENAGGNINVESQEGVGTSDELDILNQKSIDFIMDSSRKKSEAYIPKVYRKRRFLLFLTT